MRPRRTLAVFALLGSCVTPQKTQRLEIALTIDDLPVHGPIPADETPLSVTSGIIAALTHGRVPAYGFVNAHWTAEQPDTLDVLKAWRAAGLDLGNHTWAHRHLSEMALAEFDREVARNEGVLRSLRARATGGGFAIRFLTKGRMLRSAMAHATSSPPALTRLRP